MQKQIKENQEFQDNIKLISSETNKITESPQMSKAREIKSSFSKNLSLKIDQMSQNKILAGTGKILSKTGQVLEKRVIDPISNTKSIKEITNSASNAHFAEYKPKEIRDQERTFLQKKSRKVEQDLNATGIELHKSSKFANAWNNSSLKQTISTLGRGVEESDHPIAEFIRTWRDKTRINETEEAKVIRSIKNVDPTFKKDLFLKEMTLYIIPDVLELVLKENAVALAPWCAERALAKLKVGFEAAKSQGLIPDSKLLDIRKVDIRQMTLLEDELPVILIGFSTHELLVYKNKKGEVALGSEDSIQTAHYVIAFTKKQLIEPEAEVDPKTGGWVIVDWHRAQF